MSTQSYDYDYIFKIVIIGDSGVGKTSIISRFCGEEFSPILSSTIGVDCRIKMLELEDKKIKLQLWDMAGQERFRYITETYYKMSQGFIIVFDLTSYDSYLSVKNWVNSCSRSETSKLIIPKIIVGNKNDIFREREVNFLRERKREKCVFF